MAAVTRDGWPLGTDQRRRPQGMIDSDNDDQALPPGKKWECCTACHGRGKILVDDVVISSSSIPRAGSVPLNAGTEEATRRYSLPLFWRLADGVSPVIEGERRRGNNPFGPRGTLRCLACQRRKKRVHTHPVESV